MTINTDNITINSNILNSTQFATTASATTCATSGLLVTDIQPLPVSAINKEYQYQQQQELEHHPEICSVQTWKLSLE